MGEKEDTAYLTKDDDTLTYESESDHESIESDSELLVFDVSITREELSSILNQMNEHPVVKEVGPTEWSLLLESSYYRRGKYNGQDCIIFNYDELRGYVMANCWKDLPRSVWDDILKEQCSTVSLNHSQMVSLQLEIDNDSLIMTPYQWNCMAQSDLYMKEYSEYPGEVRIRFTYAKLAACIINTCWEDITLKKWRELCENEKTPLTGAFASASLDFSIPLSLPRTILRPTVKNLRDWLKENKLVSEIPQSYEMDDQIRYIKKLIEESVSSSANPSTFLATGSNPIQIIDGRRRIHAINEFYDNIFPVNGTYFSQMGEDMSLFMQHRIHIQILSD
jgi:hypothetical protein